MDEASGLLYDHARYYDPQVGSFTSADSGQQNAQGMNPYVYVGGNPETLSDPSGQRACSTDFSQCVPPVGPVLGNPALSSSPDLSYLNGAVAFYTPPEWEWTPSTWQAPHTPAPISHTTSPAEPPHILITVPEPELPIIGFPMAESPPILITTPAPEPPIIGFPMPELERPIIDFPAPDLLRIFLSNEQGGSLEEEATPPTQEASQAKSLAVQAGGVGAYNEMVKLGRKGNGLTPHHVPQGSLANYYGFKYGEGATVMMDEASHKLTYNYGGRAITVMRNLIARGATFREAVEEGIQDYLNSGVPKD